MDIIIFAAIAFYLFFKLNKQLGKIDEEEKRDIEAKIINIKSSQKPKSQAPDKIIGYKTTKDSQFNSQNAELFTDSEIQNLDNSSKKALKDILQKLQITNQFFIEGAKTAFESILRAFAADELQKVKFLLSDKIYQGFKDVNDKRKAQGKSLVTNIISFDEVCVMSANIDNNFALIAVKFISQQINYISNSQGDIIVGSKDEINQVEDIWTFKKDLKSNNPNWIVNNTDYNI